MFDLSQLPRTLELVKTEGGAFAFEYIDERLLPGSLVMQRTEDWKCVVDAIKTLAVRGAPAIGVAGAAAIALWAGNCGVSKAREAGCACAHDVFAQELADVSHEVETARPTAVNLAWGVRRMCSIASELLAEEQALELLAEALFAEVKAMERQDEAINRAMGAHGAELIPITLAFSRIAMPAVSRRSFSGRRSAWSMQRPSRARSSTCTLTKPARSVRVLA